MRAAWAGAGGRPVSHPRPGPLIDPAHSRSPLDRQSSCTPQGLNTLGVGDRAREGVIPKEGRSLRRGGPTHPRPAQDSWVVLLACYCINVVGHG